jgi:hypothetical protein
MCLLEIGIFDEANARRFPSKWEVCNFFLRSFRVRNECITIAALMGLWGSSCFMRPFVSWKARWLKKARSLATPELLPFCNLGHFLKAKPHYTNLVKHLI